MNKNAWTEFVMRSECKGCWWDDDMVAEGLTVNNIWWYCKLKKISISNSKDCFKRQYEENCKGE